MTTNSRSSVKELSLVLQGVMYAVVIVVIVIITILMLDKYVIRQLDTSPDLDPLVHITLYTESGDIIREWEGRYKVFDHKDRISIFSGPSTNRVYAGSVYGNTMVVEVVEE